MYLVIIRESFETGIYKFRNLCQVSDYLSACTVKELKDIEIYDNPKSMDINELIKGITNGT